MQFFTEKTRMKKIEVPWGENSSGENFENYTSVEN